MGAVAFSDFCSLLSRIGSNAHEFKPSGIKFWQSVGIGIGFMQKVRFSVGIGIGFRIQKVCWDLSVLQQIILKLKKTYQKTFFLFPLA
jgi:hypothetical protein